MPRGAGGVRGGVLLPASRRLGVLAPAQRIGYIASPDAASLVTGRTKNVGVVIPFVNRWFFGEVLEGAERALLSAGYDLTLYNLAISGPKRDRVFDFFLARKRVDAVIAVGVDLEEREVDQASKYFEIAGPSSTQQSGYSLEIDEIYHFPPDQILTRLEMIYPGTTMQTWFLSQTKMTFGENLYYISSDY